MTKPNPFGNDASMRELVDRIRGADVDGLQPTEMRQHIDALKIISEATITRYETVLKLEQELRDKLSLADIREGMSEVLVLTREGNERRASAPRDIRDTFSGYHEIKRPGRIRDWFGL